MITFRKHLAWSILIAGLIAPLLPLAQETLEDDTQILFVFDASNSMNSFWEGNRKIMVATRLLSESLDELYGIPGLQLGLRVYGHQTKFVQGNQDCDDTELVVPFSTGNNLVIKRSLARIQARGTTPIARSLERAAEDFPAGNGRKVIVLITDGIEACDEDPCAVSQMLQARGIIVKPFIIGIGLEEQFKETFRCVGNFFDATDAETFREVLDIVLEQAMHDTTYEIDLMDSDGVHDTNVAVTLRDQHTGQVMQQFMHTLNQNLVPDTMHIDPVPTYDVTVHTLPPLLRDSVRFNARSHNHLRFQGVEQGTLRAEFARSERNEYGDFHVLVSDSESGLPVHSFEINKPVKFLSGTYDVHFPTAPPTWVRNVAVRKGQIAPVIIPQPGYLQLDAATAGYGTILTEDGLVVYKFDIGNPSARLLLQPGNYTLLFRARSANSSEYSVTKQFSIVSRKTHHLSIHG
ncbi:MAG: VWA domain-containing protein [Bacteroidetes bacterium]|jgi:Ca-activated chloride channel homolog|nr:VWA domain-containing protein [Bacteroidota bacterium]